MEWYEKNNCDELAFCLPAVRVNDRRQFVVYDIIVTVPTRRRRVGTRAAEDEEKIWKERGKEREEKTIGKTRLQNGAIGNN